MSSRSRKGCACGEVDDSPSGAPEFSYFILGDLGHSIYLYVFALLSGLKIGVYWRGTSLTLRQHWVEKRWTKTSVTLLRDTSSQRNWAYRRSNHPRVVRTHRRSIHPKVVRTHRRSIHPRVVRTTLYRFQLDVIHVSLEIEQKQLKYRVA